MISRREAFYVTIKRWWLMAGGGHHAEPFETDETLRLEDILWHEKERYERGETTLREIKPYFERWMESHKRSHE